MEAPATWGPVLTRVLVHKPDPEGDPGDFCIVHIAIAQTPSSLHSNNIWVLKFRCFLLLPRLLLCPVQVYLLGFCSEVWISSFLAVLAVMEFCPWFPFWRWRCTPACSPSGTFRCCSEPFTFPASVGPLGNPNPKDSVTVLFGWTSGISGISPQPFPLSPQLLWKPCLVMLTDGAWDIIDQLACMEAFTYIRSRRNDYSLMKMI